MNEVVLLGKVNSKDEALALRAFKDSNFRGVGVATTRGGAEVPGYTFAGHPDQSALSIVVELPKANGPKVLRRQQDAERTEVLPALVYARADQPCLVNDHVVGSYLCGSHTSEKPEDQAQRIGLCRPGTNVTFTEASLECKGPRH